MTAASKPAVFSRAVHQFDLLRDTGALARDPAKNEARWKIGAAIRRTHALAWFDPFELEPNPIDGPNATVAQRRLEQLEQVAGQNWPVVARIVIAGATASECGDLVCETPAAHVPAVVLDRLRTTLDRLWRQFPELAE